MEGHACLLVLSAFQVFFFFNIKVSLLQEITFKFLFLIPYQCLSLFNLMYTFIQKMVTCAPDTVNTVVIRVSFICGSVWIIVHGFGSWLIRVTWKQTRSVSPPGSWWEAGEGLLHSYPRLAQHVLTSDPCSNPSSAPYQEPGLRFPVGSVFSLACFCCVGYFSSLWKAGLSLHLRGSIFTCKHYPSQRCLRYVYLYLLGA